MNIRNFCIIAHIDHGKSTLADRMLEETGTVEARLMRDQFLDTLVLERKRGITIKLQAVRMQWRGSTLNLIDTPGHVDFAYEVSRSLAACEGAILLVDATQGVEAQTVANVLKAIEANLKIIPVVNKIDLPSARAQLAADQMSRAFGFSHDEILYTSGKTGKGVSELLDQVIERIPAPKRDVERPLRALIVDSFYDTHRGVVALVRVFDGQIKSQDAVTLYAAQKDTIASEVGVFAPSMKSQKELSAGEVGYLITGLKSLTDVHVGDTVVESNHLDVVPLPGYRHVKPVVFAGLYPVDADDYDAFRDSLEKLQLNDASLSASAETSSALGNGFRCGFLGLLHLEITKERLEQEYDMDVIITSPTVLYRVCRQDGTIMEVRSSEDFPDPSVIQYTQEPWVRIEIYVPDAHTGAVMTLCQSKRGEYVNLEYIQGLTDGNHKSAKLVYLLPLAEMVTDFFDQLKSVSQGYASMDYEPADYREAEVVKVTIMINQRPVSPLSFLTVSEQAPYLGRAMVERLKEVIPRQQFKIPIQALVGGKILARADVSAFRKDVTAKLYGGDVTRKMKLLEKQKRGKKRMKRVGDVDLPKEAFMTVLKH